MEFREALEIVGEDPVFDTGLLLAGDVNPKDVRRQLSRWVSAGKLIQLRRGLYALAPPYRKTTPHPFLIANRMVRGSYVSLQTALAYHGMIPEYVPTMTSVTTYRAGTFDTALGTYAYHHIDDSLLFGHELLDVGEGQHAYVASREKALLDLIYLEPGRDGLIALKGMRLHNLGHLDLDRLHDLAVRSGRPKLRRAVASVEQLVREEESYETLPQPTP